MRDKTEIGELQAKLWASNACGSISEGISEHIVLLKEITHEF